MTLKLEKPPAANGPLVPEVGKTYVDASGVEVRIVAIRRITQKDKGYAPFIGLRWDAANGTEVPKYYFENGSSPTGKLSEYLVKGYKPPVYRYLNVYPTTGHASKEDADYNDGIRIGCIRLSISGEDFTVEKI